MTRPRWPRPCGDWRPAAFTQGDVLTLVVVVYLQAVVRAYDYATGDDARTTMTLHTVERAFPLHIWAALILAGASIGILGMLLRRHMTVWIGHGILLVVYVGLCAGIAASAASHPYLDGIRGATALLGPIVIHVIVLLRMGPRPLPRDRARPTETIAAPNE